MSHKALHFICYSKQLHNLHAGRREKSDIDTEEAARSARQEYLQMFKCFKARERFLYDGLNLVSLQNSERNPPQKENLKVNISSRIQVPCNV